MILSIDTETTGVLWQDTAFCVTTAYRGTDGVLVTKYFDLSQESEHHSCTLLLNRAQTWVFHNAKFDLQKLLLAGVITPDHIWPERMHDTMVMAHLVNENGSRRLKDLARDILGEDTEETQALKEYRREHKLTKDDGYASIPRTILEPYAKADADFTLRLYEYFEPSITKGSPLEGIYKQEIKVLLVLLKVEAAGLKVDIPYLRDKIRYYGTRILEAKRDIEVLTGLKVYEEADCTPRELSDPVYTKSGKVARTHETKAQAKERALSTTFNPNSPAQVQRVFGQRGIHLDQTNKDTLGSLTDPLASAMLSLRELVKIRQTYLLGILEEQDNGILHPNFRSTGTVTGRMSSGTGE
jgi:DNA polymerase-1